MPYRKVKLSDGFYYHVYNRGVKKSNIFFMEDNYDFFLKKMKEYLPSYLDVLAYCLMPNHFHIMIFVKDENLVTKALSNFLTSYSKSINKLMRRNGPLFDGRFKAKLIPENNYLLHLSRYIHLNPVRKRLVTKAEDWNFSSYRYYIESMDDAFIKNEIILEQIPGYKEFVESYNNDQRTLIADLLFG